MATLKVHGGDFIAGRLGALSSGKRGDDRPHELAIERAGQIASLQAVDDLDRAAIFGVPHELEHSVFEDDVGQVELLELLDMISGMNFALRSFFGSAV